MAAAALYRFDPVAFEIVEDRGDGWHALTWPQARWIAAGYRSQGLLAHDAGRVIEAEALRDLYLQIHEALTDYRAASLPIAKRAA